MTKEPVEKTTTSGFSISDFFINLLDRLILYASIWAALALCVAYMHLIPDLNWPWYLDKILIFILVLALVISTLEMLKPIIALAIIGGIIFLCVSLVQNEGTTNPSHDNNPVQEITILNSFKSISGIDSLTIQNAELKSELEKVQIQLDSISKQLKTIMIDNSQTAKMKNVD
jgi:hypothetical protein